MRPRRLLLLLAASCLAACGSTLPDPASTGGSQLIVGDSTPRRVMSGAHWALVETIRKALDEGDDAEAKALVRRLRLQGGLEVEELAQGFDRVLEGRALVRAITFQLTVEPLVDEDARERERSVRLDVWHGLDERVVLELPIGRLDHLLVSLAPTGLETRELETRITHELDGIRLKPGERRSFEVARYLLPMEGAIAVRERWSLTFGDGSLRVGKRSLPAANVQAGVVNYEELAPEIPREHVLPAKLVEYVQGRRVFMPLLLEHAVRIDPARREETVRALLPVLERLAVDDLDRGRMLAPALRWLTRSNKPGVEPVAWVDALRERFSERPDPNLDLPNR